ncbi:MAG: phosphotransferase [Bacillota bacterium]|nr:phosphotransferase [Bacillota bacterium]
MRDLNLKVKEIISETFNINKENINIDFIDHSILDRNYVYKFNLNNKEYVIKISYSHEKWSNEINVLNLLIDNYFVPNILSYGDKYNLNYIIMEKFPGYNLNDKIHEFSKKKQLKILCEIGENLALIHSEGEYYYYGWNKSIEESSLIETRKKKDKRIIEKIKNLNFPEVEIVNKGIEILNSDRYNLKELTPKLTHKDFSLRNILVDNRGEITGIIDYEHSEPEDPSLDICSMFHTNILDDELYFNSFKKGYERILKFPENFLKNRRYYMVNTGLYLYGRFSDKGISAKKRGIELIKNSLNY